MNTGGAVDCKALDELGVMGLSGLDQDRKYFDFEVWDLLHGFCVQYLKKIIKEIVVFHQTVLVNYRNLYLYLII